MLLIGNSVSGLQDLPESKMHVHLGSRLCYRILFTGLLIIGNNIVLLRFSLCLIIIYTVYMIIYNSKRNTCGPTKLSSKCVSSCLNTVDTCNVYKPSILRSLRSSPFSKYIDKSLHNCLVSLGILRPFRGCRSGKRVKERKAYLRDLNIRMKYDGQIYISCNQNNTPTYNLSSYFPVSTQNSTDIIPERINTRNLNNLILITPNNPENHNLTCDKPIETNSISVIHL